MSPELFNELVDRVGPLITKKDTFYCKALDTGLKIACTLRYMATGKEYSFHQYAFRVARNTINKFVPEVAEAIVTVYLDEVVKLPDSQQEWREKATCFLRHLKLTLSTCLHKKLYSQMSKQFPTQL